MTELNTFSDRQYLFHIFKKAVDAKSEKLSLGTEQKMEFESAVNLLLHDDKFVIKYADFLKESERLRMHPERIACVILADALKDSPYAQPFINHMKEFLKY